MRTTLDIDEKLVENVKKITGEKGKSKAVQIALEEFVRQDQIRRLLEAPGNITLDDKVMEWRHSERGKLREFNIDESDSI
jgi:Arc/MetJ family transcription regulator